MASNKGLGKGLGALLGDFSEEPLEQSAYRELPIYKVEPNPDQPRREFDEEELQALADSISVHGVIQPLTVREMPNGYYQIIAGERRWRAARLAGLSDVPVVVREGTVDVSVCRVEVGFLVAVVVAEGSVTSGSSGSSSSIGL